MGEQGDFLPLAIVAFDLHTKHSLFLFGQHSEIASTCIISSGLLQVRRIHKLHEAQMQGFVQALLAEGFVLHTEIIFDAHAEC